MKRQSFDESRDSNSNVVPFATDPGDMLLPCRWCSAPTRRAVLADLGARCIRCYQAYCQAPQPGVKDVGDKRHGTRSWADALRKREQSGERLTDPQRKAWREALHAPEGTA